VEPGLAVRRFLVTVFVAAALGHVRFLAQDLVLPNKPGSLKFAAMGDNGTGEQPEYDVAKQMDAWHGRFPYDMVIMLGDNMYGGQQPADFVRKFQTPYKALLDAGVKFYATLGNHDKTSNHAYGLFGVGGQRYYTFARNNVRFFIVTPLM
jgi:predicted MPP superfamily phosphohydrolase